MITCWLRLYCLVSTGYSLDTSVDSLVGSITGIFRSIIGRSVVIEGRIDKLKLSITDQFPSESDVLEFRIPAEYCFTKMAVSLDASEGRVVLKVPKV